MYTYWYSTQRDVGLCKEGYDVLEKVRMARTGGDNIISADLSGDPTRAAKYAATSLPVLVGDGQELSGESAIHKLYELLQMQRPSPSPASSSRSSVDPALPPLGLPPMPAPGAQPMPAAPPTYEVQPTEPMYVLYTDDTMDDITVPADGYVTVQSYSLIRTTISKDKLPKYLRADSKPLPVLVTMREEKPTVWYGTAARDWCKLLCLVHAGAMLR
jgi:hypothetical protein